jgi:transposase-like protein
MGHSDGVRVKRTQRDYTLGFKLGIVAQIEEGDLTYKQAQDRYGIQGRSTALTWLRKYGKQDWSKPFGHQHMPKSKETPAQKIMRLEKELEGEKLKNIIYSDMVDILKDEYGINLRKKYFTARSGLPKKVVK